MTVEDLKDRLYEAREKKIEYEALIEDMYSSLRDEVETKTGPFNEEYCLNILRLISIYATECRLLKGQIYDLEVKIYLSSNTFEIKDDESK